MKVKEVLSFTLGLVSIVSGAVKTPSGEVIPNSLLRYLECPIGNSFCKDGQIRTCMVNFNDCRTEKTVKYLTERGHKLGNLSPSKYCDIHYEVCNMITNYNPPLTDDYIYNLDKYLTCGESDAYCQSGQSNSCRTVLVECWGKYPSKYCIKLADVCDKLYDEYFDSNAITTPSGKKVPKSLLTYLSCIIGDDACKKSMKSKCLTRYNYCKYLNPMDLKSQLIHYGFEVGSLTGEEYCSIYNEVCKMIDKFNPPVTARNVYDGDHYLTCDKKDNYCKKSKQESCRQVLIQCWREYPFEACNNLYDNYCSKIEFDENEQRILTPSGKEVPLTLLNYLDCPIGEVNCKNGKIRQCKHFAEPCANTQPLVLEQSLREYEVDIGLYLTPQEYCSIHNEVCDMISSYDPPLTNEYIYNYNRYLSCDESDSICKYDKKESCKKVLSMCGGKYPTQSCVILSNVCKRIDSTTTTTSKKTTKKTTKKVTTSKRK